MRPKNGEPAVPNEQITYLLLSGWSSGRVKIDDPVIERGFLLSYTKDLFEGCKDLSYVQKRTEYFRFFMDIDIKRLPASGVASPEEVRELVDVALGVVLEFVPDRKRADLTAYVCTSLPSVTDDIIKCGAHLHVPGLVVNSHMARTIRGLIIRRAHERWPDGSPHKNDLEDIYDEVVYLANGLRMVGSVKYAPCRECSRGDAMCTACGGYGKLMDTCAVRDEFTGQTMRRGRSYSLTQVLGLDNDSYHEDTAKLAQLTLHSINDLFDMVNTLSIRIDADHVSDWIKVPSCAEMPRQAVKAPKSAPKGASPRVYDLYPDDVVGMNKQVTDYREVPDGGEMFKILQRVLQEVVVPSDPRREGIFLKKARERQGLYIMYPGGPGSTLCGNKKGDGMHRSNSIYFLVTASGVNQRCFSNSHGADALAERTHGTTCKDYKSRTVSLHKGIRQLLFPIESMQSDQRWTDDHPNRVTNERAEAMSVVSTVVSTISPSKRPRENEGLSSKRRWHDPGARRAMYTQYKTLSLAFYNASSRGPAATKCKVSKVSVTE
jgi:hypothetical protein